MTIVAGLADPGSNSLIFIADSRLTRQSDQAHYDVCQKIARIGNHGLVGFSGDVKKCGEVCSWIAGTYKKRGVAWLNDESEVMYLLRHVGVLGQPDSNSFMVAFMDDTNPFTSDDPLPTGDPRATLVRFSSRGEYERKTLGIEIIGSGSEVIEDFDLQTVVKVMNFGGTGRKGIALAHRSLLLSEWVVGGARKRGISSVGGLMQVHFVESRGVRAVTYERWVHLDEHHGTYVRMEIDDDGAWLQVHEPTNLRVPLRFPGDTDFLDAGDSKDHNFELERLLTLDSPGVKRTPNPVEIYRPITTGDDGWIVRTP